MCREVETNLRLKIEDFRLRHAIVNPQSAIVNDRLGSGD